MPGGLMSLLAVGAQDQYLTASPEMSYFRQVYRRPTNFSMESIHQTFMSKPILGLTRASFTCRIGRYGDLLQQIYMAFKLPAIYSDNITRFRWIKNIASHMIISYTVSIDTQVIDKKWGEWMDIWNELSQSIDKKYSYDKMTGNYEDYNAPRSFKPTVVIQNNILYYSDYPNSTPLNPSIPEQYFYVPLDFWFTRNPSLALPLIALQYQSVDISIELRGIEELYQVASYNPISQSFEYISPSEYNTRNPSNIINISKFLAYGGSNNFTIDLDAYLECNFYFLDTAERTYIASNNVDILIDRVYQTIKTGVRGTTTSTVDLIISNPIKEHIWVMRKSDMNKYNDWGNYTLSFPEDGRNPIMKTAKFIWNGMDRIEEKSQLYFNSIQPHQHHTTAPRGGIYCYSYALQPEKLQPSGTFNASMITKIQLYLTTNGSINDEYEVIVYSIYNNIFRITGGMGGMVFAT